MMMTFNLVISHWSYQFYVMLFFIQLGAIDELPLQYAVLCNLYREVFSRFLNFEF